MAYWGMARASGDRERAQAFMKKALAGKDTVTPRERAWLETWALVDGPDEPDREKFRKGLEQIVLDYPDDLEAKVLYAETSMFSGNRVGADLLLKQVLAIAPDHPGAHHYRVHLWDGPQGAQALDSCRRYGELVPRIGHALHMPGHVYAGLGMWHEAAISLDSATRAEIRYMGEKLVFPYNTWNYAHNRNYLSYVQEQLGLPNEAIRGARELLAVPLDPKLNDAERYSPHCAGRGGAGPRAGQVRALGRDPRRRLDSLGHDDARQGAAGVGGDARALRQRRRRRGAQACGGSRRVEGRVRQARAGVAEVAVHDARR